MKAVELLVMVLMFGGVVLSLMAGAAIGNVLGLW